MLRSAANKVMWVGRATVFLVGLAVILALVVGFATAALAGTGVGATFNHRPAQHRRPHQPAGGLC